MAITLSPSSAKQKYLKASGPVDVIKDCAWAVFDGQSSSAGEVPYISLIEWQPIGDQFTVRAEKFVNQIGGLSEGIESYKDTYKAEKTGNTYKFPFFTTEMRSKMNNWTKDTSQKEAAGKILGAISDKFAAVGGVVERGINVLSDGTVGIEYPKIWQGTDIGSTYTFDFYLHNTISMEQTSNNWNLTYLLSYNNSYGRRNLLIQDAPVLYQVSIPGIRYSPVSAMKSLNIEMVGQMRNMGGIKGISGKAVLPESYHISITMEDLYVESRQIMELVTRGGAASDVHVFTSKDTAGDAIRSAGSSIGEFFNP